MNPRYRLAGRAAAVLVVIWVLALAGFGWARATRPTAERVARFMSGTRLSGLGPEERARVLRRLAELLNSLPPDERRKARMERLWQGWFEEMTEAERGEFLEATAPSGIQQMLTAFEQLPADRRQRTVDEAVKRLREAREAIESGEVAEAPPPGFGTDGPPLVLSETLRERVATLGLQTYYSQSSARTKAEMAPLLEELQRMMENGALRRGPMRRPSGPAEEGSR